MMTPPFLALMSRGAISYPRVLMFARLDDTGLYLYDTSTQSASVILAPTAGVQINSDDISPDGSVWLADRFSGVDFADHEFLVWVDGVLTATSAPDFYASDVTNDGSEVLLVDVGVGVHQNAYKAAPGDAPALVCAGTPFGMSGDGRVFSFYNPPPGFPTTPYGAGYATINVDGVVVQIGVDYGQADNVSNNGRWVVGYFLPDPSSYAVTHPFIYDRDTDTLTVRTDVIGIMADVSDDGVGVGGNLYGGTGVAFKMTIDGTITPIPDMFFPYACNPDGRVITGLPLDWLVLGIADLVLIDDLPPLRVGYDLGTGRCSNVLS